VDIDRVSTSVTNSSNKLKRVAVTTVDRTGNESTVREIEIAK
jgi:hypothetical protein